MDLVGLTVLCLDTYKLTTLCDYGEQQQLAKAIQKERPQVNVTTMPCDVACFYGYEPSDEVLQALNTTAKYFILVNIPTDTRPACWWHKKFMDLGWFTQLGIWQDAHHVIMVLTRLSETRITLTSFKASAVLLPLVADNEEELTMADEGPLIDSLL